MAIVTHPASNMYIVLLLADGPEQLPVPVPLVRNLTMTMMLI